MLLHSRSVVLALLRAGELARVLRANDAVLGGRDEVRHRVSKRRDA